MLGHIHRHSGPHAVCRPRGWTPLHLKAPLPLCHFISLMCQNPKPRWTSHTCAARCFWTNPVIRLIVSYIKRVLASNVPCYGAVCIWLTVIFPLLTMMISNLPKSPQTSYCITLPVTLQKKKRKTEVFRYRGSYFPICSYPDLPHFCYNRGALLGLHLCFGAIPSS